MEDRCKLHDRIVTLLLSNRSKNNIVTKLKREEYFFSYETVDFSTFQLMKKRKKVMQKVAGYLNSLTKLGQYFDSGRDSVIRCRFIFESKSHFLFFDYKEDVIITSYVNPNVNIKKVVALNKEYELRCLKLIEYEHMYPLNLDT